MQARGSKCLQDIPLLQEDGDKLRDLETLCRKWAPQVRQPKAQDRARRTHHREMRMCQCRRTSTHGHSETTSHARRSRQPPATTTTKPSTAKAQGTRAQTIPPYDAETIAPPYGHTYSTTTSCPRAGHTLSPTLGDEHPFNGLQDCPHCREAHTTEYVHSPAALE